jgi:hypothetical protein
LVETRKSSKASLFVLDFAFVEEEPDLTKKGRFKYLLSKFVVDRYERVFS